MGLRYLSEQLVKDYQALDCFGGALAKLIEGELNFSKKPRPFVYQCFYVQGNNRFSIHITNEKGQNLCVPSSVVIDISRKCFYANFDLGTRDFFGRYDLSTFKGRLYKFALKMGFVGPQINIE